MINTISKILEEMEPFLTNEQNDRLKNIIKKAFDNDRIDNHTNEEYMEMYLSVNKLEGLSVISKKLL